MPMHSIIARFRVSCLQKATDVAAQWQATHVISLLDPELGDHMVPTIRDAHHLVFRLRDQEDPSATAHFPDIVANIFENVRSASEDPASRLLVHCHAGISRSTAVAYAMIAHNAGPGREAEAFDALLAIVNKPWPNRRIIEILDEQWQRDGALLRPLDAMRALHPMRHAAWERYNEKRGLFKIFPRYAR